MRTPPLAGIPNYPREWLNSNKIILRGTKRSLRQSPLLGLGLGRSPVGFALSGEGVVVLLMVTLPGSNIGAIQLQTDEIQTAGFLMTDLKSNLDAFFSALDSPGANRAINPISARIAIVFLYIGASL